MTELHNIRVSADSCACWELQAPSEATTISDKTADIVETCRQLFDIFGEFLTPTALTYEKRVYRTDRSLESVGYGSNPSASHEVDLADDQGLTFADFLESTESETSGIVLIPQIRFEENRYLVRFGDGDRTVERSDCVLYHKGEPRESAASKPDPLSLVVNLRETSDECEIETEYARSVSVYINSDVWVKDTDAGNVNRTYLSDFLKKVETALEAQTVCREQYNHSDFWYDLSLGTPDEVGFDMASIF